MIVTTKYGKIEGLEQAGLCAYLGIPYAKPPVGALRWREPLPPEPWEGVREAKSFGSMAIQANSQRPGPPMRPGQKIEVQGSEDCLYLNVWTPKAASAEKLPVFVWVHGGAYCGGNGNLDTADPSIFTSRGIILVSMNYRLGLMGYFAHPELSKESEHGVSGNYAHFDQIMALDWIRENIAAFGGDPENITLGGCSAGSGSVQLLACSPLSKGKFRRLIVESSLSSRVIGGVGEEGRVEDLPDAEARGVEFMELVGAKGLAELRAMPYSELIAPPESSFRRYFHYGTTVGFCTDGYLIPMYPALANDRMQNLDIPYIAGNTHDEGGSMILGLSKASYEAQAHEIFGEYAEEYLRLCAMETDADAARAVHDTHTAFAATKAVCAANNAAGRAPHYVFDFARPHPTAGGAFHGWGNRYLLGMYKAVPGVTEVDDGIAAAMQGLFCAYIKTGDPNAPGLPEWRPYRDEEPNVMVFNDPVGETAVPFGELNSFAEKVARGRITELCK